MCDYLFTALNSANEAMRGVYLAPISNEASARDKILMGSTGMLVLIEVVVAKNRRGSHGTIR